MKTNFDAFKELMEEYLLKKGQPCPLISDIEKTSYSKEVKKSLCNSPLLVLDMDKFAQDGYRKIVLPDSISIEDSINTADAFLINKSNEWYFIEFKYAKLGNAKTSVLKKAYSNMYAIMDVLFSMKGTEYEYKGFNYDNPISFIQNNVKYILVFSEKDNPQHTLQMMNHKLIKENYLPEFMRRLQGYIYKEAYAMTETAFMNSFLKNFCY